MDKTDKHRWEQDRSRRERRREQTQPHAAGRKKAGAETGQPRIRLEKHQRLRLCDLGIGYFDEAVRDREYARARVENEPLTDDLIHDILLARHDELVSGTVKKKNMRNGEPRGLRARAAGFRLKCRILRKQELHLNSYLSYVD